MILLKYAKLLPLDATENLWGNSLPETARLILENRIKEFVVCGYNIDSKDACLLSEIERALLYSAKVEWEKEKIGMKKLLDMEGKQEDFWKVEPNKPLTESEYIEEYLSWAVLNA